MRQERVFVGSDRCDGGRVIIVKQIGQLFREFLYIQRTLGCSTIKIGQSNYLINEKAAYVMDATNQTHSDLNEQSVPEMIVDYFIDQIRKRELHPGDRLPPERELAESMNVSRASIREAIRSLSLMNLVEMKRGSGTFVSSLEPDLLVERLQNVFALNDATFLDLIKARQVIEPELTALAALQANAADIEVLADILDRSKQCLNNNPMDFPLLDIEFHLKIAEIAQNFTLLYFMKAITQLSVASSTRTADEIQGVREAIESHTTIFEAIKEKDKDLARLMMYRHLGRVENKILKLVNSSQDEE